MNKETRDFNKNELIKWIAENNEGIKSGSDFLNTPSDYLLSRNTISELKVPDGWKYNHKRGIISNKRHFFSKDYVEIKIVEDDYFIDLI